MVIKPEELRIGNLLSFVVERRRNPINRVVEVFSLDKKLIIVKDMGLDVAFENGDESLREVLLTPEILIACGFKKLPGSKSVFRIFIDDLELSINYELGFAYIDTIWGQAPIKKSIFQYLHQVQNLVFALTNTELNYKP